MSICRACSEPCAECAGLLDEVRQVKTVRDEHDARAAKAEERAQEAEAHISEAQRLLAAAREHIAFLTAQLERYRAEEEN